jgi:hypothetical protein
MGRLSRLSLALVTGFLGIVILPFGAQAIPVSCPGPLPAFTGPDPVTGVIGTPGIICIDDLTDGPPSVTTNIPGVTVGAGPDSATISGITIPLTGGTPLPRAGIILETGLDFNPPNSDVATLFGGTTAPSVLFQSDTFATVPVFTTNIVASLVEDGTFQLLPLDPDLEVFVRSDIGGSEVPEPSTLLILASALTLAGLLRCKAGEISAMR